MSILKLLARSSEPPNRQLKNGFATVEEAWFSEPPNRQLKKTYTVNTKLYQGEPPNRQLKNYC